MGLKSFNSKKKTFIIAEIGNNHEGSVKNAKKLIKYASKAGVDAVKFQTFITRNFVIKKNNLKRYNLLSKFELSQKNFLELKKYSKKYKVKFISTPLDLKSADFLIKHTDVIKIASSDNNFFPLIEKIIKSNKKVLISTGMTDYNNIYEINKFIKKKIGKNLCQKNISYLHCVTSYPVLDKDANLKSISFLKKKFDNLIGYSDHTLGNEACLVAVALGAKIIEKHFTLNKKFSKFRDHALSADFKDLKELVKSVRKIENQLGIKQKKISISEKKIISLARRGVYASKKIEIGEKLTHDNVKFLRPANNKEFFNLNKILNKKSKKNYFINQKISL